MRRYFNSEGYANYKEFDDRLCELYAEVEDKDLAGLLKVRNKMYALKRKYEETGRRFLDCEYAIMAINELIAESR